MDFKVGDIIECKMGESKVYKGFVIGIAEDGCYLLGLYHFYGHDASSFRCDSDLYRYFSSKKLCWFKTPWDVLKKSNTNIIGGGYE